tara:strand:+ start:2602 stop:2775 length:174 start_codon:yes stop_codon:yes gene_type:complete
MRVNCFTILYVLSKPIDKERSDRLSKIRLARGLFSIVFGFKFADLADEDAQVIINCR